MLCAGRKRPSWCSLKNWPGAYLSEDGWMKLGLNEGHWMHVSLCCLGLNHIFVSYCYLTSPKGSNQQQNAWNCNPKLYEYNGPDHVQRLQKFYIHVLSWFWRSFNWKILKESSSFPRLPNNKLLPTGKPNLKTTEPYHLRFGLPMLQDGSQSQVKSRLEAMCELNTDFCHGCLRWCELISCDRDCSHHRCVIWLDETRVGGSNVWDLILLRIRRVEGGRTNFQVTVAIETWDGAPYISL